MCKDLCIFLFKSVDFSNVFRVEFQCLPADKRPGRAVSGQKWPRSRRRSSGHQGPKRRRSSGHQRPKWRGRSSGHKWPTSRRGSSGHQGPRSRRSSGQRRPTSRRRFPGRGLTEGSPARSGRIVGGDQSECRVPLVASSAQERFAASKWSGGFFPEKPRFSNFERF